MTAASRTSAGVAADCLRRLRERRQTVSAAESLTAGLVTSALASMPGSSAILRGGMTAYATDVKIGLLGVDRELVDRYGVVSAECAEQMAQCCVRMFDSSWAVSTTGVAGPDLQEGQPVGRVFVAVATAHRTSVESLDLDGSRQQIREEAAASALRLLQRELAALGGRGPATNGVETKAATATGSLEGEAPVHESPRREETS